MTKTAPKDYISNPFKVIFKGFDKLFKHNQTMAIVILVLTLLGSVGQTFNYGAGSGGGTTVANETGISTGAIVGIVALGLLVFILIMAFFGTVFNGAVAYVVYKTSKSETTNFSDTMKAVFGKFWTILGIEIVVALKVIGGLILFIIPGIRASLRYNLVLLPVFDEDAGIGQAMKRSKEITKDHLLEVFGMVTAAAIIPFVGPIMQYGGQAVMYPQLKALKDSGATKPQVHWLNYLGFILIGAFVLFALLIALIVVVALNSK